MSKRQLSILIASLFAAAPVLAQGTDPFLSRGQVTAGGIWTDTSGTTDTSKFTEYQDLSNGMLSNIGVTGRNASSWIDAYGENFGRQDMYVNIRGGLYNVFKAQAYTNWIPHDFLTLGITPYAGSGSANLAATFPKTNLGTWNNVNLGYDRKNTGGYFEWQQQSPWYFRVDGNQVKVEGTKVGSWANGTSPGNGYVDTAIPVDQTTNNVALEGGYTTRTMTLTASYLASNFNNANQSMTFTNPFFTNQTDRAYLPPNNDYQRFALNGTWRELPWKSTLALRYTWDKTTNDVNINNTVLNAATGGGVFLNVAPNTNVFSGDEVRQTFTAGWAATPVASVDTKLYYNWQKMNNDGTEVIFCPSGASTCGGTFENDLWHYEKNNFGLDAWWRINRANRLGVGYDWYQIKQNRIDFDENTTNTFWAEWKNNSIETVQAKVKYWYLKRSGDYLLSNAGANANDPLYLERFTRFFDLADLTSNRFKVNLDWAPSDNVGVAFEYQYKKNDYDETTLGRNKDTRNEVFANLTYAMPNKWRATLFGDYEKVEFSGDHRYISNPVCATPNCNDPSTPPTSTAYNWSSSVNNNNWILGLGLDVPVNEKLMITGSLMYEQVDGSSDMTAQNNYGNPLPLPNYPNVKMTSLNLKGTYNINKNWSTTLGYAYQKYDYTDDAFTGYTNILPITSPTSTSLSYLNGWNAFQSYNANIVYLTLKFSWDPPSLPPPAMKVAEAPARPVAAPPPPPPPPPPPAPAPAPQVHKITLDSKVLFDFDKAVLKPEGKAAIDNQVVGKLSQVQKLEVVLVTGHTDRLGSDAYNQKLSQQRADAVGQYLASKGVDRAKIQTVGMGEKQPVVQCDQKNRKELIACLAPNRRVDVELKGEAKK